MPRPHGASGCAHRLVSASADDNPDRLGEKDEIVRRVVWGCGLPHGFNIYQTNSLIRRDHPEPFSTIPESALMTDPQPNPSRPGLSPSLPDPAPAPYRQWQLRARRLLEPLEKLMRGGRADLDIEGQPSDHDRNADRLESFARPLLLFVHWRHSLETWADEDDLALAGPMEAWFRQALVLGTSPQSPAFWGYSANFHQHSVEMGLMVIALELSRGWLWECLDGSSRDQISSWLESDVGNGHHWNNHMFFGIFVMEFLLKEGRGRPSYRAVIDRWFHELEGMYQGEGWFMDGMNQAFDFYNAYAWHYYGLWWNRLYGKDNPGRCDRWAGHARTFLEEYPHFFATSGEHPAFGRSITYRFNATAPFGLAQLSGISPVDPGLARLICEHNIDFFLSKPIFQSQGCLSLGWHDEFIEMVEVYSCGGSAYWAAKALSPLLLELEDPFWGKPGEELPASVGDFSRPYGVPGLIVRSIAGEVEIINAGSQIASTNTRFGPYKWGHLSYRTGMGFLFSADPDRYPFDSGLTAENEKAGTIHGRHYTAPVAVEPDHMACLYSLGRRQDQFQVSVETHMWWLGGWQLIVHRFNARQPTILRHGTYALSGDRPGSFIEQRTGTHVSVRTGDRGIALQTIHGYDRIVAVDRIDEQSGPREHIQAPFHALRLAERRVAAQEGLLACLCWAGADPVESQPWRMIRTTEGNWTLRHPRLGDWTIRNDFLPGLEA